MGAEPAAAPLACLDLAALHRWAVLARAGLAAHQDQIDDLNVFPVPDNDTGTNMFETVNAAVETMLLASRDTGDDTGRAATLSEAVGAFARATMLGARGNSGVIMSQLVLGFLQAAQSAEIVDGVVLAQALSRASTLAYDAVGEPEEGTILTVVREASTAAQDAVARGESSLAQVVAAAVTASRQALGDTTGQLERLARAGVVDAGAAGFVVVIEALNHVVNGEAGPVRTSRLDLLPGRHEAAAAAGAGSVQASCEAQQPDYAGPRFEVMAVLEGSSAATDALRSRLRELGESVVVIGSDEVWRVHVHADDVAPVRAALNAAGEVADVAITDLRPLDRDGARLVVLARSTVLAEVFAQAGARCVLSGDDPEQDAQRLHQAALTGVGVEAGGAAQAVVLPCDTKVLEALMRLRPPLAGVVPVTTSVAALAAAATFDPGATGPLNATELAAAAAAVRVAQADAIPDEASLRDLVAPALTVPGAELITVLLGRRVPRAAIASMVPDDLDAEISVLADALPEGEIEVGVE